MAVLWGGAVGALWWSQGGGLFLMVEVPLKALDLGQPVGAPAARPAEFS